MGTRARNRKSASIKSRYIGKPAGRIQQRVKAVGPEHFGIVAVDCAKRRSKWMLCDFYGKVIIEPTTVEHNAGSLQAMTDQIALVCKDQGVVDLIAAVEMTGIYHRPAQRALRKAGVDTRTVHPFASSHYRRPLHPDEKTDDHDLEAIFHAAVKGYGLAIFPVSETYQALQAISRHRRNLVKQRARLQVQIRLLLHRTMPGYADLFDNQKMFTYATVIRIAAKYPSAKEIQRAGVEKIVAYLKKEKQRFNSRNIERIVAWSRNAAEPEPLADLLSQQWIGLNRLREILSSQIQAAEQKMSKFLVKTPYVLLLSVTGINVVSAAQLAGEAGPIEHYATAAAINGRAGLFPSRYQSDETDCADGPVARHCNRRLREACLTIAMNLITCHPYYRGLSSLMATQKVKSIDRHCRIANRSMRMVFQLVGGRQVWRGRGVDREYLLDKLRQFHRSRATPLTQVVRDMEEAFQWLPDSTYAAEAKPLLEAAGKKTRGPIQLSDLLLPLLTRLGVPPSEELESETSEARSRD